MSSFLNGLELTAPPIVSKDRGMKAKQMQRRRWCGDIFRTYASSGTSMQSTCLLDILIQENQFSKKNTLECLKLKLLLAYNCYSCIGHSTSSAYRVITLWKIPIHHRIFYISYFYETIK